MKSYFFTCFFFLFFTVTQAQFPGGVSAHLTLWLKADNAASLSGNPVQSWTTSGGSASGYSVSQSNASNRPALVAGATNPIKFNYNPRLKFTTAASTKLFNTSTTPNLLGNNGTAIVVTTNEVGNAMTYTSGFTTNGRYQLKPNFRFQTGINGNGYTFDWSAPTEYSTTSAFIPCSFGCGPTMALRKNSVLTTTASNSNLPLYNPAISQGLYLGANNATEYFSGSIAEVILFDTLPSTAALDRLETYLSLKYGITRGGNTGTTSIYNYVASDGVSIVWDKNVNLGFNSDIAGIGRDDNGTLNQKQSISVNNNEALTIAIGSVAIPSDNISNLNTFASDLSFLVWGNNAQANTFNAAITKPAGIQDRLDRVWKIQTTNFNQQVTLGFESAQITGLGALTSLCLLFDDDGNFSDATVIQACNAQNPTGNRIEFFGITPPVGKPYMSLAHVIVPTTITNNSPICPGSTLILTAQLISNASYTWSGPNSYVSNNAIDSIVNASTLATGNYSVSINNQGCITVLTSPAVIASTQTVNVQVVQTVGTNPMCVGAAASFLAVPANGGTNPIYQWKLNGVNAGTATTFSSTTLANNDVLTVTLTSNALCAATPVALSSPVLIGVNPTITPSISLVANDTTICAGITVLFTASTINGGANPSYQWQINGVNSGSNSSTFSSNQLLQNDAVTCVLTSDAACALPLAVNAPNIVMQVTPQPQASFSYIPLQPNETDPLVNFQNASTNATAYQWNFGSGTAVSSSTNPSYLFPGVGDYLVSLISNNGTCADTAIETITIQAFSSFFIPNTFTPNGDDLNDLFGIIGSGISTSNFEMSIYNRWGELIFHTTDLNAKWNGKGSSSLQAPEGTYVYMLRLMLNNSNEIIKKAGNFTLFR